MEDGIVLLAFVMMVLAVRPMSSVAMRSLAPLVKARGFGMTQNQKET
jgi:hypothetical protein